jgi:hypothetical protein
MSALERHVEWTSPATLWDHFNGVTSPAQRRVFRTPAILRFASDSFMDDFLATMKADPRRMAGLLATPETWRAPLADVAPPPQRSGLVGRLHAARTAAVRKLEARQLPVRAGTWNQQDLEKPLKLYQPAHQRYYLVAACLVCRTLGLPDRPLNTSVQERVSFVIRRLQLKAGAAAVNPDPAFCDELAFVNGRWTRAAAADAFVEGEEQYPLSPLAYQELDGRRRRLFNGLIPVAKREALVGAPAPAAAGADGTPPPPMIDPRAMLLKTEVLGPWARLEDVAVLANSTSQKVTTVDSTIPAGAVAATLQRANEQIQTVAWYILLDLSTWIRDNISDLWAAINAGSSGGLSGATLTAYNTINGLVSDGKTLRAALKEIRGFEAMLDAVKTPYRADTVAQWPSLKYQFVTATAGGPTGLLKAQRENLESVLVAALPPGGTTAIPVRAVAQVNAMDFASPWFVVRCVFERPSCAALSAVVSDPSASFQLAAFYDADAPARAIRITLPADTTPAGLRKFDKNTAFVMSDVMCGQFSAVGSLGFIDLVMAVLPWPLHKDLNVGGLKPCPDGGIACSFSLPIITICALIVMLIMVKLLDMIFFWMPFLQICLPVPKFDAKGNS